VEKRRILIQLDSDDQASVFDRIVAIDASADEVLTYNGIRPEHVRDIVHGAIFTRGPSDLRYTAIFIGGSDVAAGERLLDETRRHMLPQLGLSVSILLDANGANTTAAAAVLCASRRAELSGAQALVLGGTGPVGQRVALLLARQGARVRLGSRHLARAAAASKSIQGRLPGVEIEPVATATGDDLRAALADVSVVISAGAAGAVLLPHAARTAAGELKLGIDLNAVPPFGIEGIEVTDKGTDRDGIISFGAIGVGQVKMKIHKAAIARLFESNNHVLDAEEVYALAITLPT
jgi:hypothetical protein